MFRIVLVGSKAHAAAHTAAVFSWTNNHFPANFSTSSKGNRISNNFSSNTRWFVFLAKGGNGLGLSTEVRSSLPRRRAVGIVQGHGGLSWLFIIVAKLELMSQLTSIVYKFELFVFSIAVPPPFYGLRKRKVSEFCLAFGRHSRWKAFYASSLAAKHLRYIPTHS
jgi:hypothetical protein